MQFITLRFRRERPARWAVHVVENLMLDRPEGSLISVSRYKTHVSVTVDDAVLGPIDTRRGDSLLHALCFAYARRFPHIPFRADTKYLENPNEYWENTSAAYEDGTLRFSQLRWRAHDRFDGKYAFRNVTEWKLVEGGFILFNTDFPEEPEE